MNSMMDVLHIGKYFVPFKGGIENMMLALIKAQINAGLKVSVLVHHHQTGIPYSEHCEFGAKIHRLPIWARLLFVPLTTTAFWHLKKILKHNKVDVIHAHVPNVTCFWLLILMSHSREKLVVHWHSDVLGEKTSLGIKTLYPIYRIFERALLKRADSIIVTSDNYLKSSKPLIEFRDKCAVIPLGLEDMGYQNEVKQNAKPDVLCIGRLTYYKGHEYLIRAFAELEDRNVNLTIVGGGEQALALGNLAKKLGVAHRVQFLGHVDDHVLHVLLNACDFLVLPSVERTEAFGLVLLEAMRASKACICTNVEGSGMSSVVINGVTGLVVEHSNVQALSAAIAHLLSDRALNDKMGGNGRKRFLSSYQISEIEQQIRRLYCDHAIH